MLVKAALILAVLALVIVLPAAGQTTNTTIVAGQSAGGVRVGANVSEAIAVLGSLYERGDTKSGKFTAYAWALRPVLLLSERETGRVVLVVIASSDAYRTDRGGITGGTERQTVEATYGREYTTDEEGNSISLIYDALGIAFEIDKGGVLQGRVSQITVFVSGQWKAIVQNL